MVNPGYLITGFNDHFIGLEHNCESLRLHIADGYTGYLITGFNDHFIGLEHNC